MKKNSIGGNKPHDIEIRIDNKTIWLTKEGLIELINLLVQQLGHT